MSIAIVGQEKFGRQSSATALVPGEFVLMRKPASGITRDNVSASDKVLSGPLYGGGSIEYRQYISFANVNGRGRNNQGAAKAQPTRKIEAVTSVPVFVRMRMVDPVRLRSHAANESRAD